MIKFNKFLKYSFLTISIVCLVLFFIVDSSLKEYLPLWSTIYIILYAILDIKESISALSYAIYSYLKEGYNIFKDEESDDEKDE